MIDYLQQFVTTYSRLFSGEPVLPMPQKPEELSMKVTMAMRDETLFFGRACLVVLVHRSLPADV